MDLRRGRTEPRKAIVLAEGELGKTGGKTANGVICHSEIFDVEAIIDSEHQGQSAQDVLDMGTPGDIPIVSTTEAALNHVENGSAFVIGVAPAGGKLPESWVTDIETAIRAGYDIFSGLHTFLSEQKRWSDLAGDHGVELFDIRKPPESDNLRVATGKVEDVDTTIVLTLGTDCSVGKRTTTYELYKAAKQQGLDAGWIATGQTGILVGAQRGVVIDRVPSDFAAGVVEDLVCDIADDYDVLFVEGQAALTHRAYGGVTLSILQGAWPDAVILADEPGRNTRVLFERFQTSSVAKEIELIESIADTRVVAISTWGDSELVSAEEGLPAGNVYDEAGVDNLLQTLEKEIRR